MVSQVKLVGWPDGIGMHCVFNASLKFFCLVFDGLAQKPNCLGQRLFREYSHCSCNFLC